MDYNKIALEKYIDKNNYPNNWDWSEIVNYENNRWLSAYDIQKWWKKVKKKSKFVNKLKTRILGQRKEQT